MKHAYSCALILAVCFGVYANSLHNSFHYDDFHSIVNNINIRGFGGDFGRDYDRVQKFFSDPGMFSVDSKKGMYRPLLLVSYALNYALGDALIRREGTEAGEGGFDVTGYHLVNIIIHGLNSCLLFWLALLLTRNRATALTAGLLFALHPLGTEPVNYISSRSESQAALFYLLGLCLFASGSGQGKGWQLPAASVALGLGLLSKSTVITLPAVLLLYDYLVVCSGSWRQLKARLLRRHLLGWSVTAWYLHTITQNGFLTRSLDTPVRDGWSQFLTQAKAVGYYLHTLVMPVHLSVEPQFFEQQQVAGPVVVSLLLALSLCALFIHGLFLQRALKQRYCEVLFLSSWPVVSLLPVLVFPLNVFVNERRLYLPCAAFCVCLALLIHGRFQQRAGILQRPRIRRVALSTVGVAVFCILFAALSLSRNRVWADDFSLWSDAVEKSPLMPRVHLYLGNVHKDAALRTRDRELELAHWKEADEAYETVIELKSDEELSLRALNNRGSIQFELRDYLAAEPFFRKALEIKPMYADANINLGSILLWKGRRSASADSMHDYLNQAISMYERALSVLPNQNQGLTNLGVAYQELGQYQKALSCYNRARALNPTDWMVLRNLGSVHLALARRALAEDKPADGLLLKARRYFTGSLHFNEAEEDARVGLEKVEELLRALGAQ
ncbi:MAG: tetratricopeptide repeat protein [Candidatus Latescibacterota bacterium]|nr:tetratricopeptide repeat protein [Candidatus Latescibacterota bacterium]